MKTSRSASGSSSASISAASLSSSTLSTSTTRRAAAEHLRQRGRQRCAPRRVVRAVVDRQRTRRRRPRAAPARRVSAAARRTAGGSSGASQERLGGGCREREVAALETHPTRRAADAEARREPRPASRGARRPSDLPPRGRRGAGPAATTSVAWSRTTASFSSRCRRSSARASACARARRWSAPAPATGSRSSRRSGRRARPRSRATSTSLAGQLVVGGRGQRLELGDLVVLAAGALHQLAPRAAAR